MTIINSRVDKDITDKVLSVSDKVLITKRKKLHLGFIIGFSRCSVVVEKRLSPNLTTNLYSRVPESEIFIIKSYEKIIQENL